MSPRLVDEERTARLVGDGLMQLASWQLVEHGICPEGHVYLIGGRLIVNNAERFRWRLFLAEQHAAALTDVDALFRRAFPWFYADEAAS